MTCVSGTLESSCSDVNDNVDLNYLLISSCAGDFPEANGALRYTSIARSFHAWFDFDNIFLTVLTMVSAKPSPDEWPGDDVTWENLYKYLIWNTSDLNHMLIVLIVIPLLFVDVQTHAIEGCRMDIFLFILKCQVWYVSLKCISYSYL
jgi:hypothetical protein